jgi:ATP-dependent protease HslVU (ClpYQ) peptidase subunit
MWHSGYTGSGSGGNYATSGTYAYHNLQKIYMNFQDNWEF